MSNLGQGNNSGYPYEIDTRQIFQNAAPIAPDSNTRMDAEVLNDLLSASINVQTTLGANVHGGFGSLAARLNQFMPGGGIVPNVVAFTQRVILTISGAVHNLNTRAILYQVYDQSSPRMALDPGTVTVSPTNYDLEMTFAVPQDGVVVLGAPSPQYTATFLNVMTLTILGSAHGLGTAALFYQVYDDEDPANAIEPGTVEVHPTRFDVTMTFAVEQSGTLILSVGGPRYVQAFSEVASVTIPGTTHQLGSAALLFQCYDNSTPAMAFEPQSVTVHEDTYNVEVTFGSLQSGVVVLTPVAQISGSDFDIRDAGVLNQTAVRMFSSGGDLNLQAGSSEHVYVRDPLGGAVAAFETATGRLGLGTTSPTFQLQLTTDSAAKPGTNTWTIFSDARLKHVLGPYTAGLELILQLAPLWYAYNGLAGMPQTGEQYVGVLAQALQPLAPYMVRSHRGRLTPDGEETDILTYDGHAMTFALINAVKQLAERVLTLEAALAARPRSPHETQEDPPHDAS